jgi:hypothetical protein
VRIGTDIFKFIASIVQNIYYNIIFRAGERKPVLGSPRFQRDRNRLLVLVIGLYLLYTVYESFSQIRRESTYYSDLGLSFDATERDIKSRFRRVAAAHHPDKAGSNDDGSYFIHLKTASDVLQDPAKRFAYERFGPRIVAWQNCVTIKEYLVRGFWNHILAGYAMTAASVGVMGFFGYAAFAKYYRWVLILILWVFEIYIISRPTIPTSLQVFNAFLARVTIYPPILPFQAIVLARQFSITLYMAISQIGPLVVTRMIQNNQRPAPDQGKALEQGLGNLEELVKVLDSDALRLMDTELAPFKGDERAKSGLKGKMRQWLVSNTIRADPMVRDALGQSFRRRRVDAPAGAKGNRT